MDHLRFDIIICFYLFLKVIMNTRLSQILSIILSTFFLMSFVDSKMLDKYDFNVALIAENMNTGKYFKTTNNNHYFTPASCTKIISGLYFLDYFKEDFKFKTKLQKLKSGSYILKFGGDYTLTRKDVENLLASLKDKKIDGKLILDASLYQNDAFSPNILLADRDVSYSMPVSSAIIDRNLEVINVFVDPKTKNMSYKTDAKEKVRLKLKLSNANYYFSKRVNGEIVLHGEVNKNHKKSSRKIATLDPAEFVVRKINKILKTNNIRFTKGVEYSRKLKTYEIQETVKTHLSLPFIELIKVAFRESDNLAFDSYYSYALNQNYKKPDWHYIFPKIKQFYKDKYNIDFEHSYIVDGSGMSRYNRIKPTILHAITKKAFENNKFMSVFPNVKSKEGRFQYRGLKDNIYAKTGTMAGISCLSGFIKNKNEDIIFTLLSSNYAPTEIKINKIEDRIINQLSDI